MNKVSSYLNKKTNELELSYLQIRKAVGVLGIILPVVLATGAWLIDDCKYVKDSISDYYYTIMGSVLVGILCGVALFLYSYKGYNNWDRISSNLACVFALGIAFFPTNVCDDCAYCNILGRNDNSWRNGVHYTSAALFFITLACMSLFLFTKTKNKGQMTKQKRKRNMIYKTCGYIMIIAIAFIASLQIHAVRNLLGPYKPTFWLESVALWAFGFSWLTKGEFLLKD